MPLTADQQALKDAFAAAAPDLEVFLASRATILRPGTEENEWGGRTPVTVGIDRPCKVARASARQAMAQDFTVQQAIWEVSFARGEDVRGTDTIVIDGNTYTVIALLDTTFSILKSVLCSGGPK